MIVSWFSAGASSAVATKMALEMFRDLRIIYTHIEDQHPDTMRFLRDCERWFGREIEILQSPLKTVENALRAASFVKGPHGSPCTDRLKRRVRKQWERENPGRHLYVWGMDANESGRVERLREANPEHDHLFPLIDAGLDKPTIHGMLAAAGIKRPAMYDLSYPNNNCLGCLKGGMGYWQAIRLDFPEVFAARAKMEREIGGKCLKEFWLDELPEGRGKPLEIIVPDCGLFCELPSIWPLPTEEPAAIARAKGEGK